MTFCPECRKNNVWFEMTRGDDGIYRCENCGHEESSRTRSWSQCPRLEEGDCLFYKVPCVKGIWDQCKRRGVKIEEVK